VKNSGPRAERTVLMEAARRAPGLDACHPQEADERPGSLPFSVEAKAGRATKIGRRRGADY